MHRPFAFWHPDFYREQNAQSQRYNRILLKSLPARPSQTHGQRVTAVKFTDDNNESKNGQLITRAHTHLPALPAVA